MTKYNSIFEIITEENHKKLKKYFYDRPKNIISWNDNRSKNKNKVTLKSLWTFVLFKDSLNIFLKHWKKFFNNWNKGNGKELKHPEVMSTEDRNYFGYDLSKIDYDKINTLNIDEVRFITDNIVNVSRNSVMLVDNISVNMFSLKFSKKIKKIRNLRMIINNRLKSAYLKKVTNELTKEEYNDKVKYFNDKEKILKEDFQKWMIEVLRKKWFTIPNIDNNTPNEEMEVQLTKNIYKNI